MNIKIWFRNLPDSIRLGLLFVSVFWVIYLYFLTIHILNPNNDAELFIAFLSAPASIYPLKLIDYLFNGTSIPFAMWFTCFVSGSVQWFAFPAFIHFLVVDTKSHAK